VLEIYVRSGEVALWHCSIMTDLPAGEEAKPQTSCVASADLSLKNRDTKRAPPGVWQRNWFVAKLKTRTQPHPPPPQTPPICHSLATLDENLLCLLRRHDLALLARSLSYELLAFHSSLLFRQSILALCNSTTSRALGIVMVFVNGSIAYLQA
jgi:hypothetical protein